MRWTPPRAAEEDTRHVVGKAPPDRPAPMGEQAENALPAPHAVASMYRNELHRVGFALVEGAVDPITIANLRRAVETVITTSDSPDLLRAADGHVRKLTYPLDKHSAFLPALAHPGILELALAISPDPEGLVLTWEDVLVKPACVGLAVPIHQDLALQCVTGGVFSLGVHLDDADDNPVCFLPGSHRGGPLTRSDLPTRDASFVAVRPRAGDIVIHDVLTVHYSDANIGPRPRHTWYLEFRTQAQLRNGPWDARWIAARRAILFHAAARRASGPWPPLAPGETREEWLCDPPCLRVPHVVGGIEYDSASPYYHFD
jgi:ectoine hydroxylase-related dioxygenase (phytanoyl-CoA dioxygenase family)